MGRQSAGGGGGPKRGWERNPQHPHPGTPIIDKKHKRANAMRASRHATFDGTRHKGEPVTCGSCRTMVTRRQTLRAANGARVCRTHV